LRRSGFGQGVGAAGPDVGDLFKFNVLLRHNLNVIQYESEAGPGSLLAGAVAESWLVAVCHLARAAAR
jgi:hypothetical protein